MSAKGKPPAKAQAPAENSGPHSIVTNVPNTDQDSSLEAASDAIVETTNPQIDAPVTPPVVTKDENGEDSSSSSAPESEVRATRSSSRKLKCSICRKGFKTWKELNLHQKEHGGASSKAPKRTRSSTRISKRSTSATITTPISSKKLRTSCNGPEVKEVSDSSSKVQQQTEPRTPPIKLTLSIKDSQPIVKKLETPCPSDKAQADNDNREAETPEEEKSPRPEEKELPDQKSENTSAQEQEQGQEPSAEKENPTKSQSATESSATEDEEEVEATSNKNNMISTVNGAGLASESTRHHLTMNSNNNNNSSSSDLHNMSGGATSEEDEDMSEEGAGRLVIDDSSTSTNSGNGHNSQQGSGSNGSGSAPASGSAPGSGSGSGSSAPLPPTRCGNIQNRTYMCDDCEFTTTSAKQSLQHKKEAHGHDLTIYSCNLCDYATRYKQKLPRHYKLHFSINDGGAGGGGLHAPLVEGIFSSSSDAEKTTTTTTTPTTPTSTPTPTPTTNSTTSSSLYPSTPQGGVKRKSADADLYYPHHTPLSALPAEVLLEEGDDDDGEEDDLADSPPPHGEDGDLADGLGSPSSQAAARGFTPPQKKKRKDVSPDKYFEVAEEISSTKYGCAICGNVYKWKKSLNKHWKEKHGNLLGNNEYSPPGLKILLESGNHVQTEHRRCCHKEFLERITVKRPCGPTDAGRPTSSSPTSRADTPPQNFLNGRYNGLNLSREGDDVDGEEPLSFAAPPPIPPGPFVFGTSSQPVFPSISSASGLQRQSLINSLHAPIPSSAVGSGSVLDLTTTSSSGAAAVSPHTSLALALLNNSMDEPDSVEDGDSNPKPLDFTVHHHHHQNNKANGGSGSSSRGNTPTRPSSRPHPGSTPTPTTPSSTPSSSHSSHLGVTTEEDREVSALNELVARDGGAKEILKCPRCGEVLKTQTAYSNHMALHLQSANKRVARCGVCHMHFPNNDALNHHFLENHLDHITSYKEAVQKIPHGLQQTYHLLQTPLVNIPKLTSQETENHLKCVLCDFTAKWPAELQKHAVSHSDQRPFVCMVCGSTYKWKWDLVKHFEKAHTNLPNPYKRRETGGGGGGAGASSGTSGNATPTLSAGVVVGAGEVTQQQQGYEAEEGGVNSSGNGMVLDPAQSTSSFLFDNGSGAQDELSVARLLHTSQQAGLMLSRQPNFLDSPENSSSDNPPSFNLSGMQGLTLPTTSSAGLTFGPGDYAATADGSSGAPGPMRHMRHQKNAEKYGGPYKAYKMVEGSDDLKYGCTKCEYRARWPSEIQQHMKNHSPLKPYGCPNCTYRSKWKWDVVKHLKRCGNGGSIKDVIDYTQKNVARDAPPNATVTPEGSVVQALPLPLPQVASSLAGSEDPGLQAALQASFQEEQFSSETLNATYAAAHSLANMFVSQHRQRTRATSEARASQGSSSSSSSTAGLNGAENQAESSSGSSSAPLVVPSASEHDNSNNSTNNSSSVQYTSLFNDGQYHCLKCSFDTTSQAELKKHQMVHSAVKMFLCGNYDCTYASKWKCDVKKHKDKYRHTSEAIAVKKEDFREHLDAFQCAHCDFQTLSNEAMQAHLKARYLGKPGACGAGKTDASGAGKTSPGPKARFPCGHCSFSTNDLTALISHRLQHQAKREQEDSSCQSPSSGVAGGVATKDVDEARRKHPRKRYFCGKCEFTCLSNGELLEHQKQAHGAHICPFCSQRSDSKSDFLDHLTTHTEFQYTEFETFFDQNIYNEDDVNNNKDDGQNAPAAAAGTSPPPVPKKSKVTVVDTGSTANTIDLTTRASTPVSDGPADLTCEFCNAAFPNVVRLYVHVSHAHPVQKRQLEIAEGLVPNNNNNSNHQFQPVKTTPIPRRSPTFAPTSNKDSGRKSTRKETPPPPAKLNGRLAANNSTLLALASSMSMSPLQNPMLVAHLAKMQAAAGNSSSSMAQDMMAAGLNLSTKKHQEAGLKDSSSSAKTLFQCIKCVYRSNNLDDYQRHLQNHEAAAAQLRSLESSSSSSSSSSRSGGSAKGMRCWFCSDVFSSYPELYNHLLALHLARMVERPQQLQDLMSKVGAEPHLQAVFTAAAAAAASCRSDKNAASSSSQLVSATTSGGGGGSHYVKNQSSSSTAKTSGNNNNNNKTTAIQSAPGGGGGGMKAEWLQHLRVHTFKGYPIQPLWMNDRLWYQCYFCPNVALNPVSMIQHTAQVHGSSLPLKYRCGTCGHSSKKVQTILQHHVTLHPNTVPEMQVLQFQELPPLPGTEAALQEATAAVFITAADQFQPQASDVGPLSVSVSMEGQSRKNGGSSKALGMGSHLQRMSAVVKKESISPPRAASSPIGSFSSPPPTGDCEPLDLSTEMGDDHHPRSLSKPVDAGGEEGEEKTAEAEKEVPVPQGKCRLCPYDGWSDEMNKRHLMSHAMKGRYRCDMCSYSSNDLYDVTTHHQLHKDQPNYISCDYKEPSVSIGARNNNDDDNSSRAAAAVVEEVFRCPDCPYKAKTENSLKVHASMHARRCQYICDFCDWSADRLVMVIQHRNIHSHEGDFDPSPEDQVFANPEYAKVVPGEFEAKFLDAAAEEQEPQSQSPASEAGQTPPFKLSITKKSYSCPHCPFVTGSRTPFDFHLSQHDGEGCFPCEQCSYLTDSWSRLCQHRRLHDEESSKKRQSPNKEELFLSSSNKAANNTSGGISQRTSTYGADASGTRDAVVAAAAAAAAVVVPSPSSKKDEAMEKDSLVEKTSGADAEDDESVEVAEFPDRDMEDNEDDSNNKDTTTTDSGDGDSKTTTTTTTTSPVSSERQSKPTKEGEEKEEVPLAASATTSEQSGSSQEPELQCERCPYRTTSRLLLSQHGKHHFSGGGPVQCPCCDFSCPSKQILLVHVQLHFPSSSPQMDMDSLQAMLDDNASSAGKSSLESSSSSSDRDQLAAKDTSSSSLPEKDSQQQEEKKSEKSLTSSTTTEKAGGEGEGVEKSAQGQQTPPAAPAAPPAPACTRVYLCGICDREFEAKDVMREHERQHTSS